MLCLEGIIERKHKHALSNWGKTIVFALTINPAKIISEKFPWVDGVMR
jgi:hypothetical protein